MSEPSTTVCAMWNGHTGEIAEGERNGYYVYIWRCECGAKGKGSPDFRSATNGLRKHCGLPALPSKPRSPDIRRW